MQIQESLRPIFVVGNSRSGTTLMGRIIGRQHTVFTFDELHFFEELWNPEDNVAALEAEAASYLFAQLLNTQRNGYLTRGEVKNFLPEGREVIEGLSQPLSPPSVFAAFLNYEAQRQEKTRPCDQTPQNVLYIGEILAAFPEARIIHMVRDPRDILLSQKRRWKRPFLSENIPKKEAIRYWLNYHPITVTKLWKVNISATKRFTHDFRVREVRFEDLVANPEQVMREICQFLELDYSETLLQVPRIGSSNTRDCVELNGIDTSKSQNWYGGGLRKVEIFWCQKIACSLMTDYSYELKPVEIDLFTLAFSLCGFPIKLALAIPFSLNRVRNLRAAIARRLV